VVATLSTARPRAPRPSRADRVDGRRGRAALVSARTATAFLLMAAALGLADRRLLRTSTIEPVVAAAGAYVVLGEALTWPQLVGGLLVLSGVGALQVRPRGGAPTPPDPRARVRRPTPQRPKRARAFS
jgi:hypothetical protein